MRRLRHSILDVSNRKLNCVSYAQEFYQFEELEDKESCTTELFLKSDGVIEFGETDGPIYLAAAGTWSVPPGTDDYNSKSQRFERS
jgi:hypothetical protein